MRRRPVDLRGFREVVGEHRALQGLALDLVNADEFAVGHAAGVLDREGEQRRVCRTQADLRAGLEQQRVSAHEIDQVPRGVPLRVVELAPVVGNARAMLHELEDRDATPCRGKPVDMARYRIRQVELARLLQLHDRDGSEGLGDGTDVPHRLRRSELVEVEIGLAVAGRARNVRRLHDGQGQSRQLVLGDECRDQLVDGLAAQRQVR